MNRIVLMGIVLLCLVSLSSLHAAIYVSQTNGNNQNPGTKDSPVKEIDKAVTLAQSGDEIYIAGGIYMGTFGVGYIETDKPLKLYGSYDETFSKRNIVETPTVFQPDNAAGGKARKAFLKFTKDIEGAVIDGIVFDMGYRNAYSPKEGIVEGLETGRILSSTERPASGNSTTEEPIIQIVTAARGGDITVQNCVFVNGANFGLQGGFSRGTFRVLNNVFVGNRMAAIEIYGTCGGQSDPKTMQNCGSVEIAYNTILFSWSRVKDLKDMGYGVRIMTKCEYNIHHNIIGGSILTGVDNTRFTPDDRIKLDDNIFFVNKQGDLEYSPASNVKLNLTVDQFGDLSFASAKNNRLEIPSKLPINKEYLEGFLNTSYSEEVDFDPDSPANLWREAMGMNKQGKITSKVSMFMNRYPWRDTLLLFGAMQGYGAQTFE
ncbi:MAG: DUF1565 domain-containing protein [bacterium]